MVHDRRAAQDHNTEGIGIGGINSAPKDASSVLAAIRGRRRKARLFATRGDLT